MKNQLFLITVFCCISNIICSMDSRLINVDAQVVNLDPVSKARLVECSKAEILDKRKGYWPEDVVVTLKQFYLVKDKYEHTENPRYAVSLIGRYLENGQPTRRDTTGAYFKNELNSFGVNLPEDRK